MPNIAGKAIESFRGKMEELGELVSRNHKLIQEKRWQEIEQDADRRMQYDARRATNRKLGGREAQQGDTNDLQAVTFIVEGSIRRRAVAYIEAVTPQGITSGTGFMISPRLFLTNQHVLPDPEIASTATLTFDREYDDRGRAMKTTVFSVDVKRFALFSPEADLDFALVAVGDKISGDATLAELHYCPISDRKDKHRLGMAVNIIQHPNAMPKMIAVRNNILHDRTDNSLLYETDTQTGSSGSPVFNDDWDVVALHHYGEPFRALKDETGRTIPINMNEGIRISAIYKYLKAQLTSLSGEQREILQEALDLDTAAASAGGPTLGGPRGKPRAKRSESQISMQQNSSGETAMAEQENGTVRITIPLEVTVRLGTIGDVALKAAEQQTTAALAPRKTLERAAEKLLIDRDYTNRSGYNRKFIPGFTLDLPQIKGALKNEIASLRGNEPGAASGELKYEHFSLVMNKSTRIAIFTATNIDGETYLAVDRDTGKVKGGAEGESWFKDTRISDSYTLNQDFYSEWSTYFDRGHLTRRTDPTWGETDEEAEKANADTFHFSNCSPQHFRFNQTTKFWQGAERYVLEKGALGTKDGRKISVFQGPIFDDSVDRYADDQQIPSSFFKVIVWKGKDGLKSVGLVVDQTALLDEPRTNLGQPNEKAQINVNQWRVSISSIEKRTSLDFGKTIRDADTIGSVKQPKVGERMLKLTRDDDLMA